MKKQTQGASLFADVEVASEFRTPQCMGIGTGGVVCTRRALPNELYCRNCHPGKKLEELEQSYDRRWRRLLPMPSELDVNSAHHDRYWDIWAKVRAEPVKKPEWDKLTAHRWHEQVYLDRVIDMVRDSHPEEWAKVEAIEANIQDLLETIAADAALATHTVPASEMANPKYCPLPHEVEHPNVSSAPRTYRCHVPAE